jgi:hypothetical protein
MIDIPITAARVTLTLFTAGGINAAGRTRGQGHTPGG